MNPSETQLWTGHPTWSHFIFLWFFSFIFGTRVILAIWIGHWTAALIFGVGIVLFVVVAVTLRKATTYRITNEAVYRNDGFLGKGEQRFSIHEIKFVRIQQGPIDRLFGMGTLVFELKAGRYERLKGIKAPDVIGQKISALL